MQSELINIIEYLERDDADLEIVDQVQKLLNIAAAEPIENMIREANDNTVQLILGELVKVAVQVKKNEQQNKWIACLNGKIQYRMQPLPCF